MSKPRRALAALLAPLSIALAAIPTTTASALQGADGTFQLADGALAALPQGLVRAQSLTPGSRAPKLVEALEADVGGPVWATFHELTGVPSALVLPGVAAPNTVADPDAAEAFARAFLARHVELLAPGSAPSDFTLVSNDLDAGIRTLGFAQSRGGLAVRDAQLSFRFKADRLSLVASQAVPFDALETIADVPMIGDAIVDSSALALASGRRAGATVSIRSAPSDAFLLPYVEGGRLVVRRVKSRVVEARVGGAERSRLEVFVDAVSGEALASRELLRFAGGSLAMRVPDRAPSFGSRSDVLANSADLNVDGMGSLTDATGGIAFAGPSGHVTAFAHGPNVMVSNDAGDEVSTEFDVADGSTFVWDLSNDAPGDAQLSAFVHALQVREFGKTFAPTLPFLNAKVQVTVNINDSCNAFSDGTTINFYKATNQCENTGRIADVVYHEYGHSVHFHAIIAGVGKFEDALSEGVSDYLAATFTGDHGTARGFFYTSEPLRDLDPGFDKRWPDDLHGEPHDDGEIIGETLWDLRVELAKKLGDVDGIQHANELYYQGIRRAVDIPSMYTEILTADDDDGNIENGTPNVCVINDVFGRHGLRSFGVEASPLALEPGGVNEYVVTAQLVGLFEQCPEDAVVATTLHYKNEVDATISGELPMALIGTTLKASIPAQPTGTTVDYRIETELGGGTKLTLPDNAADAWYQFYVGDVANIYCTDFETDPIAAGWTHGLSKGTESDGADDWEWGKPKGTVANGDPLEAFSGKKAWGNDLGDLANHNGLYQPDKVNWSATPVIDVSGYAKVRLQYRRWLNVEDAFFDHATIYANEKQAWRNFNSDKGNDSDTDHRDREWRFHDLDLTPYVVDGKVQVKFELESDGGKELGGWTVDDLCIVGVAVPPDPCANGACGGGGAGGSGGGTDTSKQPNIQGGCGCVTEGSGSTPDASALLAGIALGGLGIARRRRAKR
ncbi:MAG: hypothetical protein U0414_25445 [Polyangiaceae bacterium]